MHKIIKDLNKVVSVIIDTYNYADFIEDCIDSVLKQTYDSEKIEILVVDDGSSDNTCEKVSKYKDKIKYLYKDNGGQASALNLGFEQSSGQYIVFLDSDDLMVPTRIGKVVEEFENNDEIGCVLNRRKIISDSEIVYDGFLSFSNLRLSPENADLILNSGYGTSRTSLSRSTADKLFPLPEKGLKIEADLYFNLAVPWITNISSLADYLTIYRIHSENLYCISDTKRLPLQIESMTSALNYVKEHAKGSLYFDPDLLDKLIRPYMLELEYKKIVLDSEMGNDKRFTLFVHELSNMKYRWRSWGLPYRIYKVITLPLILLLSSKRYINMKDKYYRNKIYKIRESLFPSGL